MEIDIDSVKWRDELFVNPPAIENGELVLPTGPGWGVEVNEAAVRCPSAEGWVTVERRHDPVCPGQQHQHDGFERWSGRAGP